MIIRQLINEALTPLTGDVAVPEVIHLEHPADLAHGDFSTNIAMVLAPKLGANPRDLAEKIALRMDDNKGEAIERVEVAGPGFINIIVSDSFLADTVATILDEGDTYGTNTDLAGKVVMVEYTDPNPFKEFHIGHVMTNTIGESLARIFVASGAEVHRANYQGDTGMHVAKAIYGMEETAHERPPDDADPQLHAVYLGTAYAIGAQAYENSDEEKQKIQEINKHVFEKDSKEINELYEVGRAWSLQYFETIYARLGTAFDHYYFESGTGSIGKRLVEEHLGDVFVDSHGATVFLGEEYGLHTRVFMNSEGLPTYEAKELGLAMLKYEDVPYDYSFVVTGNEVREYFQVLMKALGQIRPELAARTKHIAHGMLRLVGGKMSSRTGDVITAVSLLDNARDEVLNVMDNSEIAYDERKEIAEMVAVGAVKYAIVRQHSGKDIIFDFATSLALEGNSGPYLQYTYARTQAVMRKAGEMTPSVGGERPEVGTVERLLYRFPEVVRRAKDTYEPHHIATYLYELAQAYNTYYGTTKILDESEHVPYRLALTAATGVVLKNGLNFLGIVAPERM